LVCKRYEMQWRVEPGKHNLNGAVHRMIAELSVRSMRGSV
jgi:hypothetical protein